MFHEKDDFSVILSADIHIIPKEGDKRDSGPENIEGQGYFGGLHTFLRR
jgi:hypothetical protein